MRRLAMLSAVLAFAGISVRATDREFKDVVSAISDEFHTRPMHIPLFGLVNVVTFVVRPAGAKHIDLAVFEDLGSNNREGHDLAGAIQSAVGHAWKPFVKVWSNRGGHEELTFVYMRPAGRDCKFLITTIEPNEATVVQVKLNPDALQRWLMSPREATSWHPDRRDRDQDRDSDEP